MLLIATVALQESQCSTVGSLSPCFIERAERSQQYCLPATGCGEEAADILQSISTKLLLLRQCYCAVNGTVITNEM